MCSPTPPDIPSVFSSVLSSEPGDPHLTRTVPQVGDYGGPVPDLGGLDLEKLRDDDQRHRRVTGQADSDRADYPVGGV